MSIVRSLRVRPVPTLPPREQDLVQERAGDVESEIEELEETVEQGNRRQDQLLEAILREQRKTRRLQERTVLDKARDVAMALVKGGKSVVNRIKKF